MTLFEAVLAPLRYPFFVRGLLAAVVVGTSCAVAGTYIVLRGMAFLGDALAHGVLPGVAVGFLAGRGGRRSLLVWALGTAILVALAIGGVGKRGRLKEDTSIGIVFAGMFALGIALISTVRGYAVDLAHILFGNVLGVSWTDLWITLSLGGLVVLVILSFYKEFLVISFDPTLAATLRLPSGLYRTVFLVLVAVAVVAALQTVGAALTLAMLITPASTAYLLARRLPRMMVLSAFVGAASGILGLYLSYYVGIASGAAVVLVATACFLLVLLVAPRRGRRLVPRS